MRTSSQHAPCATAFAHPGYLFERQRAAMRQNAFARARSCTSAAATTKRKVRDDSDTSSDDNSSGVDFLPHEPLKRRRVVLEGFKRMRVSSPPSSVSQAYAPTAAATTSNSNAMSDCMMTDNEDDAAAADRAIVRVGNEWNSTQQQKQSQPVPTKWTPNFRYARDLEVPLPPTDPSCTAIVLFNAPPTAIPRSLNPFPRVELVESDEDADSSSSDDEQPFVRFEEIHDEEEPMEID